MFTSDSHRKFNYLLSDKQFVSLNSYKERVKFILESVNPLSEYIDQIFNTADIYSSLHCKSLGNSQSFQREGHHYFQRSQYNLAKISFTYAILNAPFPVNSSVESKHQLSECYAFRSMIFFEMKLYDKALYDANQSKQLSETVPMVVSEECLLNEKSLEVSKPEEKLANLWLHSNIKVESCKQKGRYLESTAEIPAKQLIIREKTSNFVFFDESVYQYCCFCQKILSDQIWPCLECNEVVFCNKNCYQRAWVDFHRYECGITGLIFNLGSNALQVFRIIAEIFSIESIDTESDFDVIEFIRQESELTNNEWTDSQKQIRIKSILNLVEHTDKHTDKDWISHTIIAIELTILLHYRQVLDSNIVYDINRISTFVSHVSSLLSRMETNNYGIFKKDDDNDVILVANCLSLFSSMINHSCDPNTKWYQKNGYIFFETKREIKRGEEITISYVPDLFDTEFVERQTELKQNYYFDCNCMACLRDIRTVLCLRCQTCGGPVVYKPKVNDNSCLKCGQTFSDIKEVMKKVEKNCEKLKKTIKKVAEESNKTKSLESTINSIESLKTLVYITSPQLLEPIRQLIKLCLHFSELKTGINLSKHLMSSIEIQTKDCENIFPEIFDDLFLLNRIYFNYLTENKNPDNEWQTGLHSYLLTIDLLVRLRDRKHSNQKSVSILNVCIKRYKKELNHLIQSYVQNISKDEEHEEQCLDNSLFIEK